MPGERLHEIGQRRVCVLRPGESGETVIAAARTKPEVAAFSFGDFSSIVDFIIDLLPALHEAEPLLPHD